MCERERYRGRSLLQVRYCRTIPYRIAYRSESGMQWAPLACRSNASVKRQASRPQKGRSVASHRRCRKRTAIDHWGLHHETRPHIWGSLWSSFASLPNTAPILAASHSPTVITFRAGTDEQSAAPSVDLLHGSELAAPFNTNLASVRRRTLVDDRDTSRGVAEHIDDGGEATRGVGSSDAGGSKAYPRNKRECSSGCGFARPYIAIEPRCPAFGSVPTYRRDRELVHNRARSKRRVAPRFVRSSM